MKVRKAAVVSYLGIPGSYSHEAAVRMFPNATFDNKRTFSDIFESVRSEKVDVAVVPVENSIAGRVSDVHSLLLSTDLLIAGEHLLDVKHCLILREETPRLHDFDFSKILRVISHPQALSQCKTFIAERLVQAESVSAADTASAVKLVAESEGDSDAAIGSLNAADTYNGRVVAEDIADLKNNVTRFLAFTTKDNLDEAKDDNITSLIFQVKHTPGALLKALEAFRDAGVNLTKLETYMVSEEITHPTFYVDVGAGLRDENMEAALSSLREKAIYIKLLGSYRASPRRSERIGFLPGG